MLTVWTWMHVLAATSTVVMAALALSRHANQAFTVPLVLMAVDQFIWNLASVGLTETGDPAYAWVGALVTPVFISMVLHAALVFTGSLRRFQRVLLVSYALFALEALVVAVDWRTSATGGRALGLGAHAAIAALTATPIALFGAYLFRKHLAVVVSERERSRTWLFITALLVGVPLLLTDLFADMGLPVFPLSTAGSCVINGLLIVISLGVTTASPRQALGQALLLGLFVVVAFLSLFAVFKDRQGLLVLSMSALTLTLLAAARVFWRRVSQRTEGLQRFATLGRFSAQMAHDLKNPLAAAKGAAELLEGEVKTLGRDDLGHFSSLLVQQLDRLTGIINRYQRLSHLELERSQVDLNALVGRVLALQTAPGVQVTQQLEPGLPAIEADPELLASALENLVKNAFEATPAGGTVTITTARHDLALSLTVTDTGTGMDPRTREQVFTLFFTTKATGSGLGLAFVQQIARAHGGEALLDSKEGQGTRVQLLLPLAR